MKPTTLILLLSMTHLPAAAPEASLRLASLFCDHAVLQRDCPLPVWGEAAPGSKVTVSLGNDKAEAVADAAGKWRATLPARPASSVPMTLTAKAGGGEATARDILVGEVWLIGGGDDMEAPLDRAPAQAGSGPAGGTLRYFSGPHPDSAWPEEIREGEWTVWSEKSARSFPAVGYYFAEAIRQRVGVPIGLIAVSGRGTSIETWINPAAIAENPSLAELSASLRQWHPDFPEGKARQLEWLKAVRAWSETATLTLEHNEIPPPPPQPGGDGAKNSKNGPARFYNALVAPLIPYAIRGVIWHQGLSNENDPLYLEKMKTLVTGWRQSFGVDFPFYFIQAPSTGSVKKLRRFEEAPFRPMMREAQRGLLALPRTGMVVSIDMGLTDHPIDNRQLGDRLARWALHYDYGATEIVPSGPQFLQAESEGNSIRVRFRYAEGGLASSSPGGSAGHVPWVGLRGADGKWNEEEAVIDGETLLVTQAKTTEPVEVAYAWTARPEGIDLVNQAGLPAAPFRAKISKKEPAP